MMVARRALPRIGPRAIAGLVVLVLLLGGGWLWFRDSSLVAVKRVTVTGASGPDATKIRDALISAAKGMTTLDVSMSQLNTAVAPYPDVKRVEVSTQFPHGIRIRVIEQIPVAVVQVAGHTIAVAGDGTLLHDVSGATALPTIPLGVVPGGTHLTGWARSAVAVLAAAPYQLLPHIGQLTTSARHGLTAVLRSGPSIYFGDAQELNAKWTAATAVLADPTSAGAVYIDVSDPRRPAAGAVVPSGSTGAAGAADVTGATTGSGAGTDTTTSPVGG